MKIFTHNGKFHADEVFACAQLQLLNPAVIINRVNQTFPLPENEIVLDIGRVYDHNKLRYDHHQKVGAGSHATTGIPLASCGLIWQNYGVALISKQYPTLNPTLISKVWEEVDAHIISEVDANDTGYMSSVTFPNLLDPTKPCYGTSLAAVIGSFNTTDINNDSAQLSAFHSAITVAKTLILAQIDSQVATFKAQELFSNYNGVDSYFILSEHTPSWGRVAQLYPNLKFVIFPRNEREFAALNVSTTPNSGIGRARFTPEVSGLDASAIKNLTGLENVSFIHNSGFMAVSTSVDSLVTLINKYSV